MVQSLGGGVCRTRRRSCPRTNARDSDPGWRTETRRLPAKSTSDLRAGPRSPSWRARSRGAAMTARGGRTIAQKRQLQRLRRDSSQSPTAPSATASTAPTACGGVPGRCARRSRGSWVSFSVLWLHLSGSLCSPAPGLSAPASGRHRGNERTQAFGGAPRGSSEQQLSGLPPDGIYFSMWRCTSARRRCRRPLQVASAIASACGAASQLRVVEGCGVGARTCESLPSTSSAARSNAVVVGARRLGRAASKNHERDSTVADPLALRAPGSGALVMEPWQARWLRPEYCSRRSRCGAALQSPEVWVWVITRTTLPALTCAW